MKKRQMNKIFSLLLTFMLCISLFSPVTAYADSEPTSDEPPDVDTAIAENYWGELEKDNSIDGGIYPKYLMKLQDSLLKNFKLSKGFYSPSTGVYKDFNTLTYSPVGDMFEYISQPELKVNEGPNGDTNYQDNKYHNPFNFSFDTDFIKDRDQLNVYGDISVNGNTEDTAVATHSVGEELKLDFSVYLSNLSKWQNTRFWNNINGKSKGQLWKIHGTEGYRATDSELVFVLNMPKGITVPNTDKLKFTVEGLNHIRFKSSRRDGDKLIITVHPSLGSDGYMTAKDYYAYLKTTNKIKISVEGLLVNDEATKDSNITITGSVVGVQDEFTTDSEETAKNKSGAGTTDARTAYFFVAKQSNEGRDAASPQDKSNLISYTFKVNKPATSTVTFINGSDRYASVKVENGKSIDEDSLTDQSMPTNPTKSGYTFKGWATKKDAKTPDFTGKTVVNNDLTVYAIWEKNSTPVNPGGGSTTDPIVPNKPERIDGNDRIETAVKVSQKSYPNGTKAVILANKDKFSDVLTAVPFSVQIGAPILFTNTDSIPVETKNEIKRLGATQVYINGGTSSVTQSIEDTLKKEGKSVTRFNGVDRYDTAKLIGERVRANGSKDVVEIASGETFPDALSISSLAVKENAPILLSKKNDLTPVTKKAISDWKIEKATIAGQTNTISAMVEKDVTNVIKKTSRLGGADRYETSAIIAKAAVPDSTLGVYTSGEVFADALVAGPYAGINKAPVLLVNKDRVPTSIAKYTKESKINRAVVIGGTSTVYDSTFNQIKDLIAKK